MLLLIEKAPGKKDEKIKALLIDNASKPGKRLNNESIWKRSI